MKKHLSLVLSLALAITIFISCSKDDNGSSTLHLRLTDAPTALDSVLIDIREVRVKLQSDSSDNGWVTLTTNAGVYNLLQLQNGVDTLLGVGTLPTGTVKQIRFILGTQNRVVAAGTSYPLTIPSGAESGLKIMVNKALNANIETLVIDFDAALSIRQEATGYKLRPVLKVK